MISCIALERPGVWRSVGVAMLVLVAVLPAVSLVSTVLTAPAPLAGAISGPFRGAVRNSTVLAFFVAGASCVVGLPGGVVAALYAFPGRKILLALSTLPLLIPSFLWAIGWSSLAARWGPATTGVLAGLGGCVLVFSISAIPLVLLVSYVATATLSGSQVDAARLAGGERAVMVQAARHAAIPALLAAGLAAVLTLSDPGPGQILGMRTAASEILTSFSALYDFSLAGQQSAALTLLVLVFAVPLAGIAAPRLASEMMVRQMRPARRLRHASIGAAATVGFAVFAALATLTPTIGLTVPLLHGAQFSRAASAVARTAGNTVLYGLGAGVIATFFGMLLAFFVGRSRRLRTVSIAIAFALLALPPAFTALGIIHAAAAAPASADFVLRSRLTVCLALGLRFFPVAAIVSLRAWASTSPTWALAAGLHGVPLLTYLRRVAIPLVLPAAAAAILLVALLATADVGTVLLLHPPGEASLPLAVFTVMANAPEALVASLCLAYILPTAAALTAVWTLAGGRK